MLYPPPPSPQGFVLARRLLPSPGAAALFACIYNRVSLAVAMYLS